MVNLSLLNDIFFLISSLYEVISKFGLYITPKVWSSG